MNWNWWVVVFLGLLVLEVALPGTFLFACCAGGALAACLASAWGLDAPWCWLLCFGTALVLMGTLAPAGRRRWRARLRRPVPAGTLRGRHARVIEALDPGTGGGRVEVSLGGRWPAAAEQAIPAGAWVEVLEVQGDRLRVRPLARSAPPPGS